MTRTAAAMRLREVFSLRPQSTMKVWGRKTVSMRHSHKPALEHCAIMHAVLLRPVTLIVVAIVFADTGMRVGLACGTEIARHTGVPRALEELKGMHDATTAFAALL